MKLLVDSLLNHLLVVIENRNYSIKQKKKMHLKHMQTSHLRRQTRPV